VTYASTEYVVRLLHTCAEQHALLPGRIPGYSCSDIQLVPSSVSKRKVWRVYHAAAEAITSPCRCIHHILPVVEDFSAINHRDETAL
ncbi:MAG: hypothetical protein MJE68_16530, partial [Proteobacteria bacterium]|nr:hypothetical protein [Pseudomonadota bacterium]